MARRKDANQPTPATSSSTPEENTGSSSQQQDSNDKRRRVGQRQSGSSASYTKIVAAVSACLMVAAAIYWWLLVPQGTSLKSLDSIISGKKARQKSEASGVTKIGAGKIAYPVPPDVRPRQCKKGAAEMKKHYPKTSNSTVSLVIPYLREKYEYIEGTLGSILDNTPPRLLREILFVSDGNTEEEGHHDKILALNPNHDKRFRKDLIRIIKLPYRHGLIYAKTRGAKEATGDIVMFFEPHCIVGREWLQPLVHLVNENPNSLILPTLDYIPQHDFRQYGKASLGRYRFEWNFNLIFSNPPTKLTEDTAVPFYAPATSGGIFAIRKERFDELSLFDVGMKQWGGDQIELSFKAWRCGGSILVVPCSRVGHLFRDVEYRPYPVDVPTVVENYAKLARVWLEKPYLEAFYKVKPEARQMARNEDLSSSKATMERLGCKSMDWYVKNVDLELGWESDKICVAAAKGTPAGCERDDAPAPGRSTIDRTMPPAEYKRWALKSEFFRDFV